MSSTSLNQGFLQNSVQDNHESNLDFRICDGPPDPLDSIVVSDQVSWTIIIDKSYSVIDDAEASDLRFLFHLDS